MLNVPYIYSLFLYGSYCHGAPKLNTVCLVYKIFLELLFKCFSPLFRETSKIILPCLLCHVGESPVKYI